MKVRLESTTGSCGWLGVAEKTSKARVREPEFHKDIPTIIQEVFKGILDCGVQKGNTDQEAELLPLNAKAKDGLWDEHFTLSSSLPWSDIGVYDYRKKFSDV